MAGSFSAQIDKWVNETKDRMVAVHGLASQKVIDAILTPVSKGGNLPLKDGFLRASFQVSLSTPILGFTEKKGKGPAPQRDSEIELSLGGLGIGDDIYGVFSAAYAMRMEYGFVGQDALGRNYNQSGYGFVRLAAQKWQTFVDEATTEAKAAVAANSGQ